MRWRAPDAVTAGAAEGAAEVERLAEVFVGGEGLARGPADVLATLLHEAAHALAHVRGVKDTSRQGRWHDAKFKALAEEVGISVEKDARIGWSPTTLPGDARCLRRRHRRTARRPAATPGRGSHRRDGQEADAAVRLRVRSEDPRLQVGPSGRADRVRDLRHRVCVGRGGRPECVTRIVTRTRVRRCALRLVESSGAVLSVLVGTS